MEMSATMDPGHEPRSPRRGPFRLGLMWRGDPADRTRPINHASRLVPLMTALRAERIEPLPVVYFDEEVDVARRQLEAVDGVMVWINPLADGRDRTQVDALLREVSAKGVWVSTHPDVILAMGTKEVVYRTRQLGWGSDTDLYKTFEEFARRFPSKLGAEAARVLKPLRGNDGQGVLKVEQVSAGQVRVQAASDDGMEILSLTAFIDRVRERFVGGLVDQIFQPNVEAGMVRCYMSLDRVVGFAEQSPRRRNSSEGTPAFGMNSAKTMHGADAVAFEELRDRMEQDWVPGLRRILGLERSALPALWDADFLQRPMPRTTDEPSFVLCEINVSSVSPFPDVAAPAIAATVLHLLAAR
jgi:hypothetical protein